MTRAQYVRMTSRMRDFTQKLPGGAKALRMPTYLCAALYIAALFHMMLLEDARLIRALVVPAICFLSVTALRPIVDKPRPYDRFDAVPVGGYRRGRGKSMPSRHTASAAAIACAIAWMYPGWLAAAAMTGLCLLIAALRVLCGQHDVSDVAAALLLSFVISLIGYTI